MESHLLQMRGLKLASSNQYKVATEVASFTDAWIETYICGVQRDYCGVASFTDAWIETFAARKSIHLPKVASFTDAWIETYQYNN